jgi:hypothetical protein
VKTDFRQVVTEHFGRARKQTARRRDLLCELNPHADGLRTLTRK